MNTPVRVLDLYSCQGGATAGYVLAGCRVIGGVDIVYQDRYCGEMFYEHDAIQFILDYAEWIIENADMVHSSPPCQYDSKTQRIMDREHPDLIEPTREALKALGLPYVLENVGTRYRSL